MFDINGTLNNVSTTHTVFIDGDLSASADGSCPSVKTEKGKVTRKPQ